MKYFIEPLLFAIDESCSEEEFYEYIENLLDWGSWQKDHENEMYILSSTEDCLYENNLYPIANIIKLLIKKHNASGVNYDTVDKMIRTLIKNSIKVDKEVDNSCSVTNLEIDKAELMAARSTSFQEQLKMLLWYEYYLCYKNMLDHSQISQFIKGVQGEIKVNVDFIEDIGTTVVQRNDEFQSYSNMSVQNYLSDDNTPYRIWKQAKCKEHIEEGIRVSVYQDKKYDKL